MLGALQSASAARVLGVWGGVALCAWFVVLGVLALLTRPRSPDPGPETMELGGGEPPAVVALFANRWKLGHEALPATLLDLAARRSVAIEDVGGGRLVCHVPTPTADDLTSYERQVLDHVRSRAVDGVVPCEALTTGPEHRARSWWARFRKDVEGDARARGLIRRRWNTVATGVLGVTAVAPASLLAAALVALPSEDESQSVGDALGAFFGLAAIAWFALMAIPFVLRANRETDAGMEVASRWLGLREFLARGTSFAELRPDAVALWDRYLAYGAALGVAATAVQLLPLGAESDTEAWSAAGGRWRIVRVRYPRRFPPGWGRAPWKAAVIGAFGSALAGVFAFTALPPLWEVTEPLRDDVAEHGWQPPAVGIALGVVLLSLVLASAVLRSAGMLVCGLSDLGRSRTVSGTVLRVRDRAGRRVAVDDGTADHIRAWLVEPVRIGPVHQGAEVTVAVSPVLGFVRSLETRRVPPDLSTPITPDAEAAPVGPSPVDVEAVAAATGVELTPVSSGPHGAPWAFADGHGGRVLLFLSGGDAASGAPIGLLARLAGRAIAAAFERAARDGTATPVTGVGDEASWRPDSSTLLVRQAGRSAVVIAQMPHAAPGERLALARAVATSAL